MAKEEQRNERPREGPATNRCAEALSSSARTGRERRRHRDAEQCYGGQRRSKAAQSRDMMCGGFEMQYTATAKHRATIRRNGTVSPGGAREWLGEPTRCVAMAKQGSATKRNETRRLCFAQLRHATAKSGTDAQRSSKAVNGGGVARQSESPCSGGDEIGKRPARDGSLDAGMQDGGGAGPAEDH